ncbi:single-stranded DNA-binding protein [bacterium]|nr:single-stranded DNA-binding protein [bacterium]
MTLAKATVSGTVYRAPEKRFTQNDIAVYGLTLNIDEREETLVRVIAKRKALADVLDSVQKGDRILVDGRLQVASSKAADGSERRYFEIDANDIELMSGSTSVGGNTASAQTSSDDKEIVTFAETDFSEDSLIDEDEIPF